MQFLIAFILHPLFISAFVAWMLAQFIKLIIVLLKKQLSPSVKNISLQLLWETGGMPSSHCAMAFSSAIAVGLLDGFLSNLFMLALAWALIVFRDAVGVRYAIGLQAQMLNQLFQDLPPQISNKSFAKIKEIRGHTFAEAIFGALLGLLVAFTLFPFLPTPN